MKVYLNYKEIIEFIKILISYCLLRSFELGVLNIALVGMPAAGKSTVAKTLEQEYGFNWIKTRDIVKELSKAEDIESLQANGLTLSKGDASTSFCEILLIKADENKPNVIDSIRPLNHLNFIKEKLDIFTVAISAPKKIRQDRLLEREGPGHDIQDRDSHEVESEIPSLIEIADYHLINTNHLYLRIQYMNAFLQKLIKN